MVVFYLVFVVIIAIIYQVYNLLIKNYNYWKKRNVPHLRPSILFGNYGSSILFRKHASLVAQEICEKFPNEPYVGSFYGLDPALIIQDPSIIKLVLAKDFYYFNERENSSFSHKEIINQSIFFVGGDRWKVLRQHLTPLFSSSKLKKMFYLIEQCTSSVKVALDEEVYMNNKVIEIKSLLARYTMDCIGNCVFGVNTRTLDKDAQGANPFVTISNKIFDYTNYGGFRMVIRPIYPAFFYALGFKFFGSEITSFFNQLMTSVFEKRQYKESSRNDFVDQLLSWKKNNYISGDSISNMKTGDKVVSQIPVDDELLIGQSIVFFAAGFETTSTTTSFILYELAKNQHAQSKIIEEIDEYYETHKGQIEYECINEMPYLQACIDETLRLYPVLGLITREVHEEYTLPTGLRLEKGTRIHIPTYHIHHNPDFFPDPEEFKPERFYGEEKNNIKQYTYMPFGEGPRICIGLRFAKMPMVAGLLTFLRKYRVELADDMPRSVKFEPRAIVTHAIGGIRLKFIPRSKHI